MARSSLPVPDVGSPPGGGQLPGRAAPGQGSDEYVGRAMVLARMLFTELSYGERQSLKDVSQGSIDAEERYAFYRRRGHPPVDAVGYALAWAHNRRQQRDRRLAHDTGAEL